jgi:non-specific serine/threonine protein kinase
MAGEVRFGDLLRRYRLAAGLTQEELAARAQVSPRAISDLERGQRTRPWRDTVQLLAAALGLEPPDRAQLEVAARRASPPAPEADRGGSRDDTPTPRHNLPVQVTSFVGRAREIAEVKRLLTDTPLLTLTGTGGCGKTRLAIRAGADLVDRFTDGVWFVDLAPLADASLVPQAVATALGVREVPGRPLRTTIGEYLRGRAVLLVLDNCEHLLDACAHLADVLLRSCPRLRVLATSREILGLAGETAWRVPSLGLPDPRQPLAAASLAQYEAPRLFLERARAVLPSFEVTAESASVVAQICARLDGMPLAIELAAARVRVLTVEQIAARLDDRFRLLTGGSRTALRRQQTLQATLDWSYQLLPEAECALLRRLAVFAGGWTLEAAEAVSAGDGLAAADIFDLLSSLVDKSLVVAEGLGAHERYRLQETLRQYADVKLRDAGEAEAVRRRHRDWCVGLAEQALPELEGPDQRLWSDRLEDEHDNLRAALAWSAANPAETPALLHLAAVVAKFWRYRGFNQEAIGWLELAVKRSEVTPSADRARAVMWLSHFESIAGEVERARPLAEEAVVLARTVGDGNVLASALRFLSYSLENSPVEWGRVRQLLEEGVIVSRAVGYKRELAFTLQALAQHRVREGAPEGIEPLLVESLAVARESGDAITASEALCGLAWVSHRRGDVARARAMIDEGLALARRADNAMMIQFGLLWLGDLAAAQQDPVGALDQYRESLRLGRRASRSMTAYVLGRCATIFAARGDYRRAARLFGATSTVPWTELGEFLVFGHSSDVAQAMAAARLALGESELAATWTEGQAMTLEQAVAYALEEEASDGPSRPQST